MSWVHTGSAAVIVAQQFNARIITQLWLVRNEIVRDDEFHEGSIFSDVVVQVRAAPFQMLVLPDQVQMVPTVSRDQEEDILVQRLGRLVRELPHTPYKALGLNFAWHLIPADGDMARISREMFYIPDRPLQRNFAVENAHFGGYMSKDFQGFRLKLEVKPMIVTLADGRVESRLHFGFNYHFDLRENAAVQIAEKLHHWNEVRQETERIIDSIEPRQQ
jgi:hypothetical protein